MVVKNIRFLFFIIKLLDIYKNRYSKKYYNLKYKFLI